MQASPTASQNILRKLRFLGLEDEIRITKEEDDRVFGKPRRGDRILKYVCIQEGWPKDATFASEHFHGTPSAYRERGVTFGALQIAFHDLGDGKYEIECDHDLANPHRFPWGLIAHGVETLGNLTSGKKTNQEKIAEIMDRQGIPA